MGNDAIRPIMTIGIAITVTVRMIEASRVYDRDTGSVRNSLARRDGRSRRLPIRPQLLRDSPEQSLHDAASYSLETIVP
jgi:hypothetical protein